MPQSPVKPRTYCFIRLARAQICSVLKSGKKKKHQRHSVTQGRTRILSETRLAFSTAKETDEETSFQEDALNTFSQCVSPDLNSGVSETF